MQPSGIYIWLTCDIILFVFQCARVQSTLDDLVNKFSSTHILKKHLQAVKEEELEALKKEHEEDLRIKDRMIDAQESEIKVNQYCQ